jgi:pyruvate dehydrogenase E2 component (dihydrolipoamide acetyltransferase)
VNQEASQEAASTGYVESPHTLMRRTIAKRLTESKRQVPHFYVTTECRIDPLLDLRRQVNAHVQADAKVSLNDLVVRAVALALARVPRANVTWEESGLRQYQTADVSVAVATPRGLVTPIVRAADCKSVAQLSAELRNLAARGRAGRLKPEEYQGGTASVSNLGMYGVDAFTAILNPPQSSIFAVGAGKKCPCVIDDAVAIATLMTVNVSLDHRAMDGVTGAKLVDAFKQLIEAPERLLE